MANSEIDQREFLRLLKENGELRSEIAKLNRERDDFLKVLKRGGSGLAKISWRIFAGRELDVTIGAIASRITRGERPTSDEIGALGGALIRRFVRVGLIAVFLALAPVFVALIQTVLLARQNEILNWQMLQVIEERASSDRQVIVAAEFAVGNMRNALVEVTEKYSVIDDTDVQYLKKLERDLTHIAPKLRAAVDDGQLKMKYPEIYNDLAESIYRLFYLMEQEGVENTKIQVELRNASKSFAGAVESLKSERNRLDDQLKRLQNRKE